VALIIILAGVSLDRLITQLSLGLFYPRGGVVDSLACKILGSAMKRLKKSDVIMTQSVITLVYENSFSK